MWMGLEWMDGMVIIGPYLIFVNFGAPSHYIGLIKVHQNWPIWPKFCVVFAKSTPPPVVTVVTNISYPWVKGLLRTSLVLIIMQIMTMIKK